MGYTVLEEVRYLAINEEELKQNIDSNTELILQFDINDLLNVYEERFFDSLARNEYKEAEKHLFDLSYDILDMTDEDQTFFLRIYFTSIVTEIIRLQTRTNRLHPERLGASIAIIDVIESWENISEFILSISWFVDALKNELINNSSTFVGNKHIEQALSLIASNIEKKHLTVQWLANELQISTTHLSNLFKLHVGETITRYIQNKRLDQIIFELKYTNTSLKKIRLKYGFNNSSHFIQFFKKVKGVTPREYKKDLFND